MLAASQDGRACRPWRPGSARDRDAGALILTYVIIVPVFMLMIMLIIQGALWYLAREAALAAARQGADAARIPGAGPGAGTTAARKFAVNSASGYLLHPQAFQAGPLATGVGGTSTTIQITVTGRVPTFVPGLVIDVSQSVQAPAEKFIAP
jgi:Flp pilus assembly protein TadG